MKPQPTVDRNFEGDVQRPVEAGRIQRAFSAVASVLPDFPQMKSGGRAARLALGATLLGAVASVLPDFPQMKSGGRAARLALGATLLGAVAIAGCGGEVQTDSTPQITAEPTPPTSPDVAQSNWIIGSFPGDRFQLNGAYPVSDSLTVWGSSDPQEGAAADVLQPVNVAVDPKGKILSPKNLPTVTSSFFLHAGIDFDGNGVIEDGEEQPITTDDAVLATNPFALSGNPFVAAPNNIQEQAANEDSD